MRLRTKFSLFTIAAIWATSGVLLAIAFFTYRTALQPNDDIAQQRLLMEWKMVCFEALNERSAKVMGRYAGLLGPSQGVEYAYFVDEAGIVRGHTFPRFVGKPLAEWVQASRLNARERSMQVWLRNRRAGDAVVGFTARASQGAFHEAVLIPFYQLLLVAGILAAVNVLATGIFADRMTASFRDLERAGREIEKGNFGVRVPETGSDELGALGAAFNRMAVRVAALDELKDEFVYSVSHDLKAPLAAMIMYVEHLLCVDPDSGSIHPRHRDILKTIEDNGRRMLVYVANILDAAKLKAGRLVVRNRTMSVAEPIAVAVSLFSMLAQKQRIELDVKLPVGMPAALGDPDYFQHVLANLLSNALKFTPAGGKVEVSALAENGSVRVSVADTGRGIQPELKARLFRPFPNANSEGFGPARQIMRGTGLGLYIVHQTLAAMGGSIAVESEPGKGARFTVTLPRDGANG